VVGKVTDLPSGIALAAEVIDNGQAAEVLQSLIRVSQQAAAQEGNG
jgi:anthranilate phosphoribosyltransferase